MRNTLIVGASRGVGEALTRRLHGTDRLWTASRTAPSDALSSHIAWDATGGAFPRQHLPERLDGLVYCPGTIRLQPFERLSEQAFEEDWQINLMGAVRTLQAALPALKAAPAASVVLFSTVAVGTGMPMHASIAAAKGAVEGLTRSLAAELAPQIRVNAIAPSLTDTPLASGLLRSERQRAAAAERHPLQRVGRVDDLADAARFLLSEDSAWITGQVLSVDGGLGALRRFN
jgi:NAD(P)-dependent dehydrogenase (short-subunit alcohol dehydrogenase family)